MKKYKVLIVIMFFIIVLDQLTKFLFINKNLVIIPSLLEFNYVRNYGIAFSLANGKTCFIVIFELIIFACVIKFIKDKKESVDSKVLLALFFILAGGISNLIDRIFRGYVIDFIDVNLFGFPSFNVADIFITIGVFIIIVFLIVDIVKRRRRLN